jgi:hypothetical protein
MTTKRSSRDPYTTTVVRLPERALSESILHLAAPLLDPPGPAQSSDEVHRALELAIKTWNGHVMASPLWGRPRPKPLADLRRTIPASSGLAESFASCRRQVSRRGADPSGRNVVPFFSGRAPSWRHPCRRSRNIGGKDAHRRRALRGRRRAQAGRWCARGRQGRRQGARPNGATGGGLLGAGWTQRRSGARLPTRERRSRVVTAASTLSALGECPVSQLTRHTKPASFQPVQDWTNSRKDALVARLDQHADCTSDP